MAVARVNELRLQRAFTLLSEKSERPRRIADIALAAGFSDISQFNRLFRSRFGDTPSGVRTASLSETPAQTQPTRPRPQVKGATFGLTLGFRPIGGQDARGRAPVQFNWR
jgi:AraC-like DNA-binding protein